MQIVDGKDYLSEVKDLITEYSRRLGRDLSFQNIDEELREPSNPNVWICNLIQTKNKSKPFIFNA